MGPESQNNEFLEQATIGRSGWWYLLGTPLVIAGFYVGLVVLVGIVMLVNPDLLSRKKADSFQHFIVMGMSFWPILISLFVIVTGLHGRKWLSLINPKLKINWALVGKAALVWSIAWCVEELIAYTLNPANYLFTFSPKIFVQFPIIFVLIAIQSFSEELFFRGYLLQATSLCVKNTFLLCLLNGVMFALPHMSNPEIADSLYVGLADYAIMGAFMAFITVKSKGLELATGCHIAQNIFCACVVNYQDGTLPTPSIFTIAHSDQVFELIASFFFVPVCYYFFFKFKGFGRERLNRNAESG